MKRIVCLFPGQGTIDKTVINKSWFSSAPASRIIDQASDILSWGIREKLSTLDEAELSETEIAQPLIFTLNMAAYYAVFENADWRASIFMGHSLGEFCCLVAANAISFEDGLRLVKKRAELMAACDTGKHATMVSVIGMNATDLAEYVKTYKKDFIVNIAAYNTRKQNILSGQIGGLNNICENLPKNGIATKRLKVGGPFHSALYHEAGVKFREYLNQNSVCFENPKGKIISSVTGGFLETSDDIVNAIGRQIESPVVWAHAVEQLNRSCDWIGLEVGCKSVLRSLLRPNCVYSLSKFEHTDDFLNELNAYKDSIWSFSAACIKTAITTPNINQTQNDLVIQRYDELKKEHAMSLHQRKISVAGIEKKLIDLLQAKGIEETIINELLNEIKTETGILLKVTTQ